MRSIFRSPRAVVLTAGLLLTATTVLLVGSLASSTELVIENDLQTYWRTTYDILVRPRASRSAVEEQHGLVEANYLAQLAGGISYAQYQAISTLPDVEVAAPVALLTYIPEELSPAEPLPNPGDDGVYLYEGILTTDGLTAEQGVITNYRYAYYYYVGPNPSTPVSDPGLLVNQPVAPIRNSVSLLLAAIDPAQEARLINLDQAIQEGQYLTGDQRIYTDTFTSPLGPAARVRDVPVLINATSYVSLTLLHRLSQVSLPPDVSTLESIISRGGADYLATLPSQPIAEQLESTGDSYPRLIESFWQPTTVQHYSQHSSLRPIARRYQAAASPVDFSGLVLEFVAPPRIEADSASGNVFNLKATGIFDIERIPSPPDVNRVPLETYYPPVAILRYDESGRPVAPRLLRPFLSPRSYVLSPPLLLTTLDAARAISGDDCARCISAIRVRVGGIDALTPAAQRKIETLAAEITHRTGLDVDIMVGSSPTRVLVHVPGVGYVEEQWIQKNVTYTYRTRVRTGHLLLLGTLFGIGGLFVLDLAWAEVVARRRLLALQKALGWRSSSVFAMVLGQVVLTGALAATLAVPLASSFVQLLGWQPLPLAWLAAVPLLLVALCLLGGSYPAWLASRVPPIIGIQIGNVRVLGKTGPRFTSIRRVAALSILAWRGLARRWTRSALGALTATLSAALLVVMLAVTVDRQGALSGTLLGEFILVRIEGYDYALVGIGFGLAALSLGNSLLAGVLDRQREIGLLKAVGWRTPSVIHLFLIEGMLLGALGGIAGTAVGVVVFARLYHTLSASLLWVGLLGTVVPMVVGGIAALYPAQVAARTPPAEAVRHE